MFISVYRWSDKLVLLAQVILLPLLVPDLEDLFLTGRLVDNAWVNRALFSCLVNVVERILRFVRREIIILIYLSY